MLHISKDYPFSNRAAVYGDGCFTTIAIEQGKAELLTLHIERLQRACGVLAIELTSSDWLFLEDAIKESASTQYSGIVKVILSAGNAGRGYQRSTDCKPHCYIQSLAPVEHYNTWRKSGICLGVSPFKLAQQESFAGIKHLNRLEQVLVKQCAFVNAYQATQDDIVLDEQDMVIEVSAGNLFWCAHGRWFTPDMHYSGVEGVMRNYVVECLLRKNIRVNRVRTKLEALRSASDVFICNSLMKIVPVNSIWLAKNRQLSLNNVRVAGIVDLVEKALKSESV